MENDLKIIIVNAQKIVKKETGEVLTKIGYMTQLDNTDNFIGYSVLDAWCNSDSINRFKDYIGKEVMATIGHKAGKNNSLSAYIKKIDKMTI